MDGKTFRQSVWMLAGCAPLLLPLMTHAQLRSGATVSLTARVDGHIGLKDRSLMVAIPVSSGVQEPFDAPIAVNWSLNPDTHPSFRVVGYLGGQQAALSSGEVTIPAGEIEAQMQGGVPRPFVGKGRLVLFNVSLETGNQQGNLETRLQIRLREEIVRELPDGVYRGRLELQAE